MLKITTVRENDHEVLLKLEGTIAAQWAALLDGECRQLLRRHKRVTLDCSAVAFIDARGVEVMNHFPSTQVTLLHLQTFLLGLLQEGDGR
ncbi:MAG: hypothetical protein U0172_00280 [Nitrospiraceae bacterium]